MIPTGSTFRFDRYRSSRTGPWDQKIWDRFVGQVISDVVPDPLLVKSITQSGEIAMRSGTPRLERCRGPVLATDGLRNFAWYRLSLPVWRLGDDTGRTPHGILVVLSQDWNDEEAA